MLLAATLITAYAQSNRSPNNQAEIRWIDVHMHLVAPRSGVDGYPSAADAAIREMDKAGIALAIVMPPPQVDAQGPYDYSMFVHALRQHAGRFAFLGGGGTLNAFIHRYEDPGKVTAAIKEEFVAEAEKIIDAGAIGFGEIAALHISATTGHPYEFVQADHPLLLALADVAARRGVPIELHMDAVEGEAVLTGNLAGGANPHKLADTMEGLARLLKHNPKARIVWAHGGSDPIGAMSAANIGRLMDKHPNLYVSMRIVGEQAPTMKNKVFAQGALDPAWLALLTRHADRFMMGSDSFIVSPDMRGSGPGVQFAARNSFKLQAMIHFLSLLPEEVRKRIAADNARRVYRIELR